MSSVTVTYTHAAPFIRHKLCYAVNQAQSAKLKREQLRHFSEAYAYAMALEIMADSADQTPVAGIADETNLPSGAVDAAWLWLGPHTAPAVFGEPIRRDLFPLVVPEPQDIPQIPASLTMHNKTEETDQ